MFKNLLARLFSTKKEGTNKEASKPDIKPTKKEVDKTETGKQVDKAETGKSNGIVEIGKLKGIDDLGACIKPSTSEEESRKRPILMVKANKEVKRPSSYLILEGNKGIVFYNRKERINKRRIWVYGKRIKNI